MARSARTGLEPPDIAESSCSRQFGHEVWALTWKYWPATGALQNEQERAAPSANSARSNCMGSGEMAGWPGGFASALMGIRFDNVSLSAESEGFCRAKTEEK